MPLIEVDFETFKAITARRDCEAMSEGDVVRTLLGLDAGRSPEGPQSQSFWSSEGVQFPVGTELEHAFRDGRVARARITETGVEVDGKTYGGLSPAGVAAAGYQLNGWRFWFVRNKNGRWVTADSLRGGA